MIAWALEAALVTFSAVAALQVPHTKAADPVLCAAGTQGCPIAMGIGPNGTEYSGTWIWTQPRRRTPGLTRAGPLSPSPSTGRNRPHHPLVPSVPPREPPHRRAQVSNAQRGQENEALPFLVGVARGRSPISRRRWPAIQTAGGALSGGGDPHLPFLGNFPARSMGWSECLD
ncbi:hypothetical protein B0H13DRAFT_2317301 [Mycena leptocephala]|nr:hypothetical protein B0H13DRAFT_2317301 [Mycena leptocephala]